MQIKKQFITLRAYKVQMKKIYIHVVACRRRLLDATKISDYLTKNDYKIVDKPKNADAIIFVTCAFINKIAEFSLDKVKFFQKYDAELIVAGCLPAIEKEKLSEIFDGKTLCTKDIDEIYQYFPEKKSSFSDIADANFLYGNLKNHSKKNSNYFRLRDYILKKTYGEHSFTYKILLKNPFFFLIRVSWGCLGNCSYCSIKKAIGSHKSKPLEECLNEFKKGLVQGHKHFLLTADDIGAYGLDIGYTFLELLQGITEFEGDFKVCIESLKPIWIVKYFEQLKGVLASHKIQYIDCAIQSGSEKILESMNRYSNIKKISETLLNIKNLNPELLLTTEIIIGFPGESKKDFHQTLSVLKTIQFDGGFIYRFAQKSGTAAENIKPKISKKEISNRIKFAKKFLKNEGYKLCYFPKKDCLIFDKAKKKNKYNKFL